MVFALILRGHVRDSFQNNYLNEMISYLYKRLGYFHIFIQTWKNIEAKPGHSWRELKDLKLEVTTKFIRDYFDKKVLIQHIMILDDSNIDDELYGDVSGIIPYTLANKKGWKYMWYGKHKIADYVKKSKVNYKFVINTRLDLFGGQLMRTINRSLQTNINHKHMRFITNLSNYSIKYKELYLKIINYLQNSNIPVFQFEEDKPGIDNFYICNKDDNFNISYLFHFHLDYIIENTIEKVKFIYQEVMVANVGKNLGKYSELLKHKDI
jgi:hypothetical protein